MEYKIVDNIKKTINGQKPNNVVDPYLKYVLKKIDYPQDPPKRLMSHRLNLEFRSTTSNS